MAQVINEGNHVQFYDPGILLATLIEQRLGTLTPSKTDEFSEKFQTAFDSPPPLIFGKLCCKIFKVATLCINFMVK